MTEKKIATILSTKIIYKQPEIYIGMPTIVKTSRGELLVVFSGDREEHICPWGKTQMVKSSDGGETWSEPVTINNTPIDDRDPGIIETSEGTILVSWFTSLAFDNPKDFPWVPQKFRDKWRRHAEKLSPETRKRWHGNWVRRSTDGGQTWEDPVRTNVSAPHGPIQLKDGRLLYVGRGSKDGQVVLGVEESQDDGRSWKLISTISFPPEESMKEYWEPHLVEMEEGRLIAMFRYDPEDALQSYMRQSESDDGGQTWSLTHKTPIWGLPPHLIRLQNSWLLVVYGRRARPCSERACISKDDGKTWDVENEIFLSKAPNDDMGYPASVQLDDGSILTVYYQIDQRGEKPCLMSTHWRLNEL